jgi:hypothetical protein
MGGFLSFSRRDPNRPDLIWAIQEPTWMPNKPNKKKLTIKLLDLTPKKDAHGGHASYSNKAPLSIPPPGFISAQENRMPDGHR